MNILPNKRVHHIDDQVGRPTASWACVDGCRVVGLARASWTEEAREEYPADAEISSKRLGNTSEMTAYVSNSCPRPKYRRTALNSRGEP